MMMTASTWQIRFARQLRKQLAGQRRDAAFYGRRADSASLKQQQEHGDNAAKWRIPELQARLETKFLVSLGCDAAVEYLLAQLQQRRRKPTAKLVCSAATPSQGLLDLN